MSLQTIEKLKIDNNGIAEKDMWPESKNTLVLTNKINELIEVVNEQSKEINLLKNKIELIKSNDPKRPSL